jgi:hypothetical protein
MGFPAGFPGTCPDCGTVRDVSGTHDAAFCPLCDEWQSPLCPPRRGCSDCRNRPARPSGADVLDVRPSQVDPDYDLDTRDDAELLRRIVTPVVEGTLPTGSVREVRIVRDPGNRREHWPADLPVPAGVHCEITLSSGEQWWVYLGDEGHLNPDDAASLFAERLEDEWCETSLGWGQQIRAEYEVLSPDVR